MYLKVEEVAERLGLCTKTVYKLISDGKLKARKISYKCIRISESDLNDFMKGV